eukprot:405477_1
MVAFVASIQIAFFLLQIALSITNPNKLDCDEQSGWQCDYQPEFSHRDGDHAFCDLDIISLDDNLNEFLSKCYFKKACIINATTEEWTNSTFWMKDNLLNEYGSYQFDSDTSINLVLRAGVGQKKYSLKQYIHLTDTNRNNYTKIEPMYIFDRTIWDNENHKFQQNHFKGQNIKFFKFASSKINYNGQILALGNTGTGATFHAHGESWLFLVTGRKRWFLYPPNLTPVGGFWPGYSSKDWFEYIYPYLQQEYDYTNYDIMGGYNMTYENEYIYNKPRSNIFIRRIDNGNVIELKHRENIFQTDYSDMNKDKIYGNSFFKPLECIQLKGQIMYLPEFWWHSVINLGNVVIGGAIQTSYSYTPWMFERDIHDEVRGKINSGQHQWTHLEEMSERVKGINAFRRLKQYGPISAVHEFFIGFEYYDMGHYKEGIEHLTNAILMDSTYLEAYSYLSRIYSHEHDLNEFYDLEKAEQILRIAYMLNPNNDSVKSQLLMVFRKTNQRELMKLVGTHQPLPIK